MAKEDKVYRVILNISVSDVDEDMCGIVKNETKYKKFFNSRLIAISTAQSLFDKQPLNGYVLAVNAFVQELKFDENNEGKWSSRIYNRYKSTPHDIYGNHVS